ncbi:MAG: PaaI family thioesterase [Candidatus Thermoplasmatota archaeon]|jgi:acyl-CoA thioesterase|nr:PaaI family thioesterase [Candidatus Thermoplasmatota archaeon]MCL5794606.1 PaaI family thioesterase [Candidatus Thermoplasmatota archaeon]
MILGADELRILLKEDGFLRNLDIEVIEASQGRMEVSVPFDDKIMRMGGIVNGGAIMSLCDLVGGLCIMTRDPEVMNQVTVDMQVNFLKAISNGPVRAVGKSVKIGKTIAYSEMIIYDGQGNECARGSGNWYLYRGEGNWTNSR